jgi:hypothetical protein
MSLPLQEDPGAGAHDVRGDRHNAGLRVARGFEDFVRNIAVGG